MTTARQSDKPRVFYRSSITGRFVSKAYAEANPDTTIKETRT